ncbi:MAG: glycosyltransferase family 2 protein [Arenicella sp.]
MQPKLSIIMPAYNHERFVGEAIEGVLQQTFADFEFIIIDDGSQDGTADVINSYKDDRIQYHYQDNQDAFNALNNGMAKAKGKFWAILNSDDVYTTDRFEKLFAFQKQTDALCLITDVIPISDTSEPLLDADFGWNQWHQKNRAKYFELKDLYAAFLHGNFMVTTSNLFINAEAAKNVGGFSALRYLHDYDYIFRILQRYQKYTHYLHDQQLIKYRIHGGNTLSEGAITAREQDQEVIRRYMLAACPESLQSRVETGLNRLIALEHELVDVKQQLQDLEQQTAHAAKPSLLKRIKRNLF